MCQTEFMRSHKPLRMTVGNLKGGTGKTTLSMLCAFALHESGHAAGIHVFDADSTNASAKTWAQAAGCDWPENIVVKRQIHGLSQALRAVPFDHHFIVDTGPSDLKSLEEAITQSDILVIPMSPSRLELARLRATATVAAPVAMRQKLAVLVVLNRVPARSKIAAEFRQTIGDTLGLPVAQNVIPVKSAIAAAAHGPPIVFPEFVDLLDEIKEL